MDLPINYTKATYQERREARNQYVILQDNLCWFCGCSLGDKPSKKVLEAYLNMSLFPKGFLDYPVHLHHVVHCVDELCSRVKPAKSQNTYDNRSCAL